MTNELAPNLPVIPSQAEVSTVQQTDVEFVPDIKLAQGSTDLVAEGQAKQGNWIFEDIDIGSPITIVILDFRHHAIHLVNKTKVSESFILDSPTYLNIKSVRNNYNEGIFVGHGFSFLLYLPKVARFASYHPTSWSAKPTAIQLMNFMRPMEQRTTDAERELAFTNQFSLGSSLKVTPKNKWHVPKLIPLPFAPENNPKPEDAQEFIKLFRQPEMDEMAAKEAPQIER